MFSTIYQLLVSIWHPKSPFSHKAQKVMNLVNILKNRFLLTNNHRKSTTPTKKSISKKASYTLLFSISVPIVHTRPITYLTKLSLLNLDEKKSKVCTVSLQCSVPSHDFFLNVWSDIVSDLRHRSCEGIRWLRWHAAIRRIGRLWAAHTECNVMILSGSKKPDFFPERLVGHCFEPMA